jgi:drug/metabolite transporter (DMT)-like permease
MVRDSTGEFPASYAKVRGMPAQGARVVADVCLMGVAVLWGATFPLTKTVLHVLPPFQYLGLRFALATLLLVPLAWRDLRRQTSPAIGWGILAGVVLFCAYALQTVGLAQTTASKAGLITGLNVVIVPLLILTVRRRMPEPTILAGVAAAAVGLWLLSWQGESISRGDALVLGCAWMIAVHIILVGRFASALSPAAFTTLQIGTVAVLGGSAGLLAEPREGPLPLGALEAIGFMAVGATLLAYLVQSSAQRIVSPSRTGLLFTLEPVAAVAFGMMWLGEAFHPRQALGAAAILAGVTMAEFGKQREA